LIVLYVQIASSYVMRCGFCKRATGRTFFVTSSCHVSAIY